MGQIITFLVYLTYLTRQSSKLAYYQGVIPHISYCGFATVQFPPPTLWVSSRPLCLP